jgi:hypothetical protein
MDTNRRLVAVGDVHGHLDELVTSLTNARLIDDERNWVGGNALVWFLGDFMDRGPSGVAVLDLVIALAEQAHEVGGRVGSLLGNHEILALGMHKFGDRRIPGADTERSFERSWALNGGQDADQEGLTDRHIDWMSSLPAIAREGDYLLLHSDTLEYAHWGQTISEVNANLAVVLAGDDLTEWWDAWRLLTTRYAFRGKDGQAKAAEMLQVLGGERLIHGHSIIAEMQGLEPHEVTQPHNYAGGLVLGVDGGVVLGGPVLVVDLPLLRSAGRHSVETAMADTAPIPAVRDETSATVKVEPVAQRGPGPRMLSC